MKRAISIGILIIVTVFLSRLMKVSQVECFTQFGTCPEAYHTELSKYMHQPILWVAPKFSWPDAKSVKIYRRLPATLVAEVMLKKPLGAIAPTVLGKESIVDESGAVITTTSDSTLPLLIADPPQTEDQTIALKLLNMLSQSSPERLIGQLQDSQLVVNYPQGLEVMIDIKKPDNTWYPSLQSILNRSKMEGRFPKKIDLRFGNPILTY